MHLCYRGNTYCSLPKQIEPVDSVITAKYRGVTYLLNRTCGLYIYNSQPDLYIYRGVAYSKSSVQPTI